MTYSAVNDWNYCVYLITNMVNGKQYVGLTGRNPKTRWREHKNSSVQERRNRNYLYRAMRLHGVESFTFSVIASDLTREDALCEEKQQILSRRTNEPEFGYNLTSGGEQTLFNPESVLLNLIGRGFVKNEFDGRYYKFNLPFEQMKLEYESGSSACQLAEKYGCSDVTIVKRLKQAGTVIRSPRDRTKVSIKNYGTTYFDKLDVSDEEIIRLYTEDLKTTTEIGKLLGVSASVANRRLKRNNIPMRKPNDLRRKQRDRNPEDPPECDAYIRELLKDEEGRGGEIRRAVSAA